MKFLHLDIGRFYGGARGSGSGEIRGGDKGGDGKCDGGEEAEYVLYPGQGVVHGGLVSAPQREERQRKSRIRQFFMH